MTLNEQERIILRRALLALNDAVTIYAPEWCDPKHVVKQHSRCWRSGGTLAYYADIILDLKELLEGGIN
jgi:hypothetical protein